MQLRYPDTDSLNFFEDAGVKVEYVLFGLKNEDFR